MTSKDALPNLDSLWSSEEPNKVGDSVRKVLMMQLKQNDTDNHFVIPGEKMYLKVMNSALLLWSIYFPVVLSVSEMNSFIKTSHHSIRYNWVSEDCMK